MVAGAASLHAENLYTGEQAVTWENTLMINADKFATAKVGDAIVVTIKEGASDVMELKSDGQWLPGSILTWLTDKTEVRAIVTDGMLAMLQGYGLELCGPSFTVTSVDLQADQMDVPEGAVWAGYFWIDEGWNTLELYKTAFNGQNPNKLIINFSPEEEESTFVLNVLTKWDDDAMKLSSVETMEIANRQAVIDLTKLPEGRTFASYFPDGQNALMIQGHVEGGNSFNITSVVVEPYSQMTSVRPAFADMENSVVDVYTLTGIKVRSGVEATAALEGLPAGLYVAGGKKVMKR